jgi:hypothetical protein
LKIWKNCAEWNIRRKKKKELGLFRKLSYEYNKQENSLFPYLIICKKKIAIITDDFRGYDILSRKTENKYQRYTVNHSIGQYGAGNGIHTNGIENFWSIFKRGWYGIYHHMSVKYL